MNHMETLDWIVILVFFTAVVGMATYFSRQAGKGTDEFFLSGRNMPWYVAGTAMVATTFAADTPLAVTELIAKNGIAGNWLWWNMAIGATLTVFFFAKLWRRADIMTDLEFIELRYSGKQAAMLRGIKAVYLGLFMNAIVMGWVHEAMEKIFRVTIPGIDAFMLVIITATLIAVYASASGLLGSARIDSIQFLFAMAGCIILAIIVIRLPEVGGIDGLKASLPPQALEFFPRIGNMGAGTATTGVLALTAGAFVARVGLQWWSAWYPGADPGGGGYIAQRMMSAKDEKHSLFATLWFTIAHYTLRPWPWILVALAALVILPRAESEAQLQSMNPAYYTQAQEVMADRTLLYSDDVTYNNPAFQTYFDTFENTIDPGVMYPKLMIQFLPPGLLGILIAVFLAAYMSTIASQLNWGTSYLINDLYKRFYKKDGTEKHYVFVSRIGVVLMLVFSLLVSRYWLTSISGAWDFIINASAGMGGVLILRWFWWRINAWSEIVGMVAPLIIYPIAKYGFEIESPLTLYPVVFGSTFVWLLATFLTSPVKNDVLIAFYKKVHPGGNGWKPIARQAPEVQADTGMGWMMVDWVAGVVMIYSVLIGSGKLIMKEWMVGSLVLLLAAVAGAIIYYDLNRRGFDKLAD